MVTSRYLRKVCAWCVLVTAGFAVYFGYIYVHVSMQYHWLLKRPDVMSIPLYYSVKTDWAFHWLTVSFIAAICFVLFWVLLRRSLRKDLRG